MYRFRLRVQIEPERLIDHLAGLATLVLPGIGRCEIAPTSALTGQEGQWITVTGPPTDSLQKAKEMGEAALGSLLLATLKHGYAMLIQARRPLPVVTNDGMAYYRQLHGDCDTLYCDQPGLTVYEVRGRTRFINVQLPGLQAVTPFANFVKKWTDEAPPRLLRRYLLAYELYASSRFEVSSRTRFLLLVMAVETLAQQVDRAADEQAVIEALLQVVAAVDGVIKARHFEARDFGGVRGLVGECEGRELNVVRTANGVSRR